MTKEKMVLKIGLMPEKHHCHNCDKGCMGDEFLKCKKLKAFESKRTYKEYDYEKTVEIMAKANWIAVVCAKNQCVPIDISMEEWNKEWEKLRKDYKKVYYAGAKAALNALLKGVEK